MKIVIPDLNYSSHPGMDGQYFKIPLDEKLIKGDVITPTEFDSPLYVVEEPTRETAWYNDKEVEFWLTTVMLWGHITGRFHPVKYLKPETVYSKIQA
jgi:hypothetical protein